MGNTLVEILQWGNVLNNNEETIRSIKNLRNHLHTIKEFYRVSEYNTEDWLDGVNMNAGFTKIYSLLLDGFIIYDGRVGSALGFLVRNYLLDKRSSYVPDELKFRWAEGRGGYDRRNPSGYGNR